ncbi:8660_t:CDS:2 [Funneliformis caledonium]|uniref:8660_t:CDS:1 n=1 Tax=Funneliformis caledonium TaxID=1117310 RepID=A0A9N9D0S0_9GLOM|nr:8660_t:CDS:2 [Funneliformis caledonium]
MLPTGFSNQFSGWFITLQKGKRFPLEFTCIYPNIPKQTICTSEFAFSPATLLHWLML